MSLHPTCLDIAIVLYTCITGVPLSIVVLVNSIPLLTKCIQKSYIGLYMGLQLSK